MDKKAFFKFSYGLFAAGVEYNGKKNACIINTAAQATSEPAQLIATMLKTNYTTQLILEKGSVCISVLSLYCPLDVIAGFGGRSGKDVDKFENIKYFVDGNGNPYLTENIVAYFNCNITQSIDLGTHYLFICDVKDAEVISDAPPMTYADYRNFKSGGQVPQNTETAVKRKRYVCSVCHYVYDGDIPFEQLPDDYKCPVCGHPKSDFVEEEY